MTTSAVTKRIEWVAVATALLLLVPLIAMRFTGEVAWGPGDFVVAGGLLFGAGTIYSLAAARVSGLRRKLLLAAAVLLGLAIVWAELAVGLFH
ncbi:MAG: hypothetical protein LCI02_19385 [Proteobacteria bacterium]|nr:hypothetical protein [Pseudomonadota bacterium]